MRDKTQKSEKEKKKKKVPRTDIVYDGVELGLVSCGEDDTKSSSSQLNRKLASDTVRCARDDYNNDEQAPTRHATS